ncbi:holin [Acinetobacter chinensis]|uniref:holin n=1 Tax=Acinetobacter chinensis TaxID=2004650 RepID=UPI002934C16B|nr:holin [Acinetobacter chinensis]WOE40657.1 holin [Acinetobacter chinensis]
MSENSAVVEASAAATSLASKTAVGGGAATLVGKFTGLDPVTAFGLLIGLAGLLVSVMGFMINWYYKRKEDKRADELHQITLQNAKGECNVK